MTDSGKRFKVFINRVLIICPLSLNRMSCRGCICRRLIPGSSNLRSAFDMPLGVTLTKNSKAGRKIFRNAAGIMMYLG